MQLSKGLAGLAKHAAEIKVHMMPSMPEPKKGKSNQPEAYDPTEHMKEKPKMRLNSVQMPGIKGMKDMKPDEECVMVCRVKMTGYNQEEYMHGEAEATFEVLEIGMMPHKK